MDKPLECTIRVFKLLPAEKQYLSIATPEMIKYKDEDVNYDYVPMIEKQAFDKAINMLKKVRVIMNGAPSVAPCSDAIIVDRVTETLKELGVEV